MTWLGLDSIGFEGAVTSILNGPKWAGADQFPALSRVRMWNHHEPSVSASLVVPSTFSSAAFAIPGSVVDCCDQAYEKPSSPLCASLAPVQAISTVASFDQASTVWLGLESTGFVGAAPSILNGPRWTAPLQFPTASRVRRWNHQLPSPSDVLVMLVVDVSSTASGAVVALCDQSIE